MSEDAQKLISTSRAIKFCRKCHGYSDTLRKNMSPDYESFKDHPLTYYDYLFFLRDFTTTQAMQAAEQALEYDAVKKCEECDYHEPLIAKSLDESEDSSS